MDRSEILHAMRKISYHFALTETQKAAVNECIELLKSDEQEINFLKKMQRQMAPDMDETEMGRMVYNALNH